MQVPPVREGLGVLSGDHGRPKQGAQREREEGAASEQVWEWRVLERALWAQSCRGFRSQESRPSVRKWVGLGL